jgi:excisionase family DNA binding protein
MSTYRRWLHGRLKAVAELDDRDECDLQELYELRSMISEAERRAAEVGCLGAVQACQIRQGPVSTSVARRVLTACLEACQPKAAEKSAKSMLNITEAAERLGIGVKSLRKLVARSKIRFQQAGPHRPIRFKAEWLDQFIAENTSEPQDEPIRASRAKKSKQRPAPINIEPQFGFDPALLNL